MARISVEILFSVILGLIAKKYDRLVHCLGSLALMYYYVCVLLFSRLDPDWPNQIYFLILSYQEQMMFYIVAAILSTEFIWSVTGINIIFIFGNLFVHYLSTLRLDSGHSGLALNDIECLIQAVPTITLLSWIIQDNYLTMFYRERDLDLCR